MNKGYSKAMSINKCYYNSIDITVDGLIIYLSGEQSLNMYFFIDVIDYWIIICVIDEQNLKVHSPMKVTEEGIEISSYDEHPLNV